MKTLKNHPEWAAVAAAFLCALCISGCVSAAQRRADELGEVLSKMHGQHKDNFIRQFGIPKCVSLSTGEICDFVRDLGVQGGSYSVPIRNVYTGQVMGVVEDNDAHQTYEKVSVEFNSSSLAIKSKTEVQY